MKLLERNLHRLRWGCAGGFVLLAALPFLLSCREGTTVRQGVMTLPWYTSTSRYVPGSGYPGSAFFPAKDSKKLSGKRSFLTIVLENEYLRVEVAPEIGGAISRAIYKPTGEDLFFLEGKAKDWLPFWESGVKVSFPYREHGVGTIQPASWRVVRRDDGSITVATWMEFSRFNEPFHSAFYGRYSAMLLSQHVTLRPGQCSFEVAYRIVNPTPFRQGRQIWSDALFPRDHIETGVVQADAQPPPKTSTELILPAGYISHHGGRDFRPFFESRTPLACYPPPHISIFAWDIPYGFAGFWYPRVKANRLRIFDPSVAPGTKIFIIGEGAYRPGKLSSHTYNFAELWGGFDNVFEGVEKWIGPGQTYQYAHHYTFVKGIGKVDYANREAAVNVEFGGLAPQVEVVTLRRVTSLEATLDGRPLGEEAACGPEDPARFPLPADAIRGRIVLTADGRVIIDQEFPLHIPGDTSEHERIWTALGHSPERYELSDGGGEAWYRNAIYRYPKRSTSRGRVLYRDGQIDAAITCLQGAVAADPADGEGWHLLGAALLEKDQREEANAAFDKAAAAQNPYAPAQYFRALAAIARKDLPKASEMLDRLVRTDPRHWEGRLLKAWVASAAPATRDKAVAEALALDAEDPADPRAQLVLAHCAAAAGNEAIAAQAREALEQLSKEPGALVRIGEFEAATRGEYKAPAWLRRE